MTERRLFEGPGVARRLAPFVLGALGAVSTLAIPGHTSDRGLWAVGFALLAAAVTVAVLVPWQRLPSTVQMTPILLALLAIAVLRHSEGGAESGLAPLVVLPIVYAALFGSWRDGVVTLAASSLVFAVPALFLDESRYPDTEWRRTIIWLIAGSTTLGTIQRLVREIDQRSTALTALLAASRSLTEAPDPRATVCAAACEAAEGDFAVLMGIDEDAYVPIAAVGTALPADIRVPRADPRSGTAQAFETGEGVFAPDASTRLISSEFVTSTGVASAMFEPVVTAGDPVAVLLIGYTTVRRDLPQHLRDAVSILARDAAAAIERQELLAGLRHRATRDPLTGIANRRSLDDFLEREISRASRTRSDLSVALIDVDHFKAYNDAHGHAAGDELLRAAADAWAGQLRPVDLLARYGGEEFVAVLVGGDRASAHATAERLRTATPPPTTCSIGVATWTRSETKDALLARADAALYSAKADGRNRTAVQPPA